jgi:hypothetical protein
MSYSFRAGNKTVWDPSLQVGKLFLGQAQTVADVLGVSSGLAPQRDGTCLVDPQAFAAFFAEFQTWYLKSRHPVLVPLARPVLAVSLALLQQIGQQPPPASGEAWDVVVAEAIPAARHMA